VTLETPPPATDLPEAGPPKRGKPAGLLRSSAIFSALTLVSRFMGLARDLVIAAKLGASQTIAADVYYTALTFPNLFRRMFAEGAFAAAFVPDYSKRLAAEGKESADRFASDALATMAALSIAITVACQLAMPWIMRVYSYGFLADPEKFKLAVILTQVTMPYLPCMVIAALFAGTLQARGRFIISGLYPTVLNLVMLAVVLPQDDPVRAAWAASWGVVVAGVSQAALCWWGAHRTGARIHLSRLKLTGDTRAMLRRMVPGVIASSATQINLVISASLASQVPGMRAWLSFAERFYQLPLSLVGVAIGVALLPRLSTSIQTKDHADAQGAMDQAVVFGMALSLPAAAALMAMPFYLIDGLFARGAFTSGDAANAAKLLFHYGWGVPAFVLIKILQPAFFARGDTRTPMTFSLMSVAVNIILGVALFYTIGFQGIALATAAASWITVAQMAVRLSGKDTYRPSSRAWGKLARVAAASAALGLLLAGASHYRPLLEGALAGVPVLGSKEVVLLLVCLVGGLIYPVLLFAFGGVTPAEARAALKRKRGDKPVAPSDLL
jgi:putative peptidoglycan lipid II flippase